WVGLAWALAYLMVGIKASYANSQTREALVEISTNLYQYSQTISIIWFLAAMTLALLLGGGTLSRRAARAGFIWLPFVIITSILVGLWLGALLLTKVPGWFQGYHNWEWTFAHTLKYNLKFAEEAMMLAQVAIFVGVPVV